MKFLGFETDESLVSKTGESSGIPMILGFETGESLGFETNEYCVPKIGESFMIQRLVKFCGSKFGEYFVIQKCCNESWKTGVSFGIRKLLKDFGIDKWFNIYVYKINKKKTSSRALATLVHYVKLCC